MPQENSQSSIDAIGKMKLVDNTVTKLQPRAKIKIVGVGGGGGNAVNRMFQENHKGVEYYLMNTDMQVLNLSSIKDENKVQLGVKATRGLGAGGNPSIGEASAEEVEKEIISKLDGADMVFIAAGMGGGTGTGAAPVVARLAKAKGILTVAVVTTPFEFEGMSRFKYANEGIEKLRNEVDAILVIPNNNLPKICGKNITIKESFAKVDEILINGVTGITDIITQSGMINTDFADIKSVIQSSGTIVMGIGKASGRQRAKEAISSAINSELLDVNLDGARSVIVNITGGDDLTLEEIQDIMEEVKLKVNKDARIFMGTVNDNNGNSELSITIIATGFELDESSSMQKVDSLAQVTPKDDISLKFNNLLNRTYKHDVAIPDFMQTNYFSNKNLDKND